MIYPRMCRTVFQDLAMAVTAQVLRALRAMASSTLPSGRPDSPALAHTLLQVSVCPQEIVPCQGHSTGTAQ